MDLPTSVDGNTRAGAELAAANQFQVLVVEDDELVRERLELVLSQAGFDVYVATSATEARSAMEALVFPIVIIDRMLGDADGIALVGELRRKYAQHRVYLILFSALDSEEERREGLKAGADDYLSKRAPEQQLLERLDAARRMVRLQAR